MNYIVFDLEWNQGTLDTSVAELPFEIVEIGAVKLNDCFEKVDTFQILVNPKVYQKWSQEIHNIVPLDMTELRKKGVSFEQAAKSFFDWCGKEEYRFCTWGDRDLTELQRNLEYYHLPVPFQTPIFYYNIQKCFSVQFPKEDKKYALEDAVEQIGIPKKADFHRALKDAEYTAAVMKAMNKEIILEYYAVDCYKVPQKPEEELYLHFPLASQYISREFYNKLRLIKDKEVCSTRCYICNREAKRKIPWYAANARSYYCLAWCRQHGYIFGKIRIRKLEKGGMYADKILKQATREETEYIWTRREVLRKKRREKNLMRREKKRIKRKKR